MSLFLAADACLSWSLPSITEQQVSPHRLPMQYWLKNHRLSSEGSATKEISYTSWRNQLKSSWNCEKSKQIFLNSSSEISPTHFYNVWRHPWGKSRGNQREIRKSRTPKLLVADPSLSSSTPRTQTVFRNNYISLLSDLCACVHLKKKWRRKGSHSSSVSGSKLMSRIASYDFKPGKKATGWCTAQWKMLMFYAKTIVKESREFELARRLKKKKKKKKKENTLAVWWLSGSVLSRCFLAPLGVLFVDHENTRRWTERCYNGL